MPKDLLFRKDAAKALNLDPRTMEKREIIKPIGTIKIGDREFDVYDKAGIEELTGKKIESK
jgi:hypothetical protein